MPAHSAEDCQFLGTLDSGIIVEFRDYKYSVDFIHNNAPLFSDDNWVDVAELRDFLQARPPSEPREQDFSFNLPSSSPSDELPTWAPSNTSWLDSDKIESKVCVEPDTPLHITSKTVVQHLEKVVNKLPTGWPIHHVPSGVVLLIPSASFKFMDANGKLIPVDAVIKNSDLDSWRGNTGVAHSGKNDATVTFAPGEAPVRCRASGLACAGTWACERVDQSLLNVERYGLDTAARDRLIAAQEATRACQGSTPEMMAATYLNVLYGRTCKYKDMQRARCKGRFVLRQARSGAFFMGCDLAEGLDKRRHTSFPIDSAVDIDVLKRLLACKDLGMTKNTPPCSNVQVPSTGGKLKYCPYAHIVEGKYLGPARMVQHPCPVKRTIYVPLGVNNERRALVFHKDIPHNHAVPLQHRLTFEAEQLYRELIRAVGVVGATVMKVDHAASSSVLLGGKSAAQHAPALQFKRIKQNLISQEKTKRFPAGLDLTGVYKLFLEDQELPENERYLHRFINTDKGGVLIATCIVDNLALIHEVTSFEADTTFKRTLTLHELEFGFFHRGLERAMTFARFYLNRQDTYHFTLAYDTLQDLVATLTHRPLAFIRFHRGGNLSGVSGDMEVAHLIGLATSLLRTIDVEYFGHDVKTPEELLPFMVRLCMVHVKRAMLDFQSMVTPAQFTQIMSLFSVKSDEELEAYSDDVYAIENPKVTAWWKHKRDSSWILRCILRFKSHMHPKDWDATAATTNTGKSQILIAALGNFLHCFSTRALDKKRADSVRITRSTGNLENKNASLQARVARSLQRTNASRERASDVARRTMAKDDLKKKIDAEQELRRRSAALTKSLHAALSAPSSSSDAAAIKEQLEHEKERRKTSMALQKELQTQLNALKAQEPSGQSNETDECSSSGRVKSSPAIPSSARRFPGPNLSTVPEEPSSVPITSTQPPNASFQELTGSSSFSQLTYPNNAFVDDDEPITVTSFRGFVDQYRRPESGPATRPDDFMRASVEDFLQNVGPARSMLDWDIPTPQGANEAFRFDDPKIFPSLMDMSTLPQTPCGPKRSSTDSHDLYDGLLASKRLRRS
ncbi:hypothetical protein AAF712_016196 [Marasmius tenuissimus]|uniref:Uncharacterized protein n=1 Tax=Marasmius tenuissimus TaxID=585030 RepID=A0ABR2Z6C5_9AGAR